QGHVNANHTHHDVVAEIARRLTVTGKDTGTVAVFMIVDQLHGLLYAVDPHDQKHWPKDLLFITGHLGGHVVDQGPTNIKPLLIPLHRRLASVDHQRSALLLGTPDMPTDLFLVRTGNERAKIVGLV